MIDADNLRDRAAAVLAAGGVPAADARVVAASLVDADLRGIHSHGVSRLRIYVDRLNAGGNRGRGEVAVLVDLPALALLDGDDLLAQIVAARAVEIAVEKAGTAGSAVVSVRRSSHFGAAGYWARLIAERGMVGLASTNTTPLMAAWGGSTGAIGTNPLALAFPSASGTPVVVDVATSESTWGALMNARASGEPIPETWALGRDGLPTTSAEEAVEAQSLLPFGRHKGYALAVAVELLAGALAGAACLSEIGDMYGATAAPMSVGLYFAAIDPAPLAAASGVDFAAQVEAVQRELNEQPPGPGVDRVLWPGQPEAERAARARREGINLPDAIVADLELLEMELGTAGVG